MSPVDLLVKLGGLLAVLTFIHFFVDWVFQTHDEAMVKHNNAKVRAKHCFIYTTPFIPLMYFTGLIWWKILIGAAILFLSHFAEDTYIPVYWWARFIRKPPQMKQDPEVGFARWIGAVPTPIKDGVHYDSALAKILMIAIDQIIHITFLIPIAFMMLYQ